MHSVQVNKKNKIRKKKQNNTFSLPWSLPFRKSKLKRMVVCVERAGGSPSPVVEAANPGLRCTLGSQSRRLFFHFVKLPRTSHSQTPPAFFSAACSAPQANAVTGLINIVMLHCVYASSGEKIKHQKN